MLDARILHKKFNIESHFIKILQNCIDNAVLRTAIERSAHQAEERQKERDRRRKKKDKWKGEKKKK